MSSTITSRIKPLLQGGCAFVVAIVLWQVFGRPVMAAIAAAMGAAVVLAGLCMPRVYTWIDQGTRRLAHWIGVALAWCVLAPLYVTGFTLARLWLKLAGRDPLGRAQRGTARSAWIDRAPVTRTLRDYQRLH